MTKFFGYLTSLVVTLNLLQCASTQTISFTDQSGTAVSGSLPLSESNQPLQYCINLDVAPTSDLTVTLAGGSSGASATAGEDFLLSPTTFTFLPGTGELQQCFTLTVPLDDRLEQLEFDTLTASSTSGSASLTLLITDADTIVVGLDRTSYSIGEEDGSISVCVVILSATVFDNTLLNFQISITATGDTATDGEDFTLSSSSVTLSSTTTSTGECVTINIESDTLVEGAETLNIAITSGVATVDISSEQGTAVLTIEDDEAATVEFRDQLLSTGEGDAGGINNTDLCLVLTFTGSALVREVVAQIAVTGGTATADEDFSLASNMVTFDASSSSGAMQCVQIMVVGDSDYESDETALFGLTVTTTGQAGSVNSATLTIMNDDEVPPTTTSAPTTAAETTVSVQPPSSAGVADNRNRNIGIGVGVGIGGFLVILVVVVLLAGVFIGVRNKRNSEKYVLNYSTVYGTGSSTSSTDTGNNYPSAPANGKPDLDGGENGSNGINERAVDVGDDANEDSTAITFKEE